MSHFTDRINGRAAAGIQNKPIATSFMKIGSLCGGAGIRGDIPGGASHDDWAEMEARLAFATNQMEDAQAALARKHAQQQEFIDRADKV